MKYNKKLKKHNGGSLMVELLVSAAIIVAAFLAASGVAQKSLQLTRQALHVAQASFLLEEGAEAVRILRDNNWSNITALSTSTSYYLEFTGGTWTLVETPSAVDNFTRTVILESVQRDGNSDIASSGTEDPNTRKVTVRVAWSEGSTNMGKEISFYLSNLFNYAP